jgi:hypothetical protein
MHDATKVQSSLILFSDTRGRNHRELPKKYATPDESQRQAAPA